MRGGGGSPKMSDLGMLSTWTLICFELLATLRSKLPARLKGGFNGNPSGSTTATVTISSYSKLPFNIWY